MDKSNRVSCVMAHFLKSLCLKNTRQRRASGISHSLIVLLLFLTADYASADLMDGLKSLRNKVKEAKETVVGAREVYREAEDLRQSVVYVDSYTPPRAELSSMQSALNRLGFSTGSPDGLMVENTRDAIRLYQRTTGRKVDGAMTYDLVQSIVASARQSASVNAKLQKFEWQQYQQLLNELGYDTGTPDGLPGPRTRSAVAKFLQDHQLPVVSGVERYGFEAASRVAVGGSAIGNGNQGAIAGLDGLSTFESNQQISSSGGFDSSSTERTSALSSAMSDAGLADESANTSGTDGWLTLGSDARGGDSDDEALRALATLLVNDNPEVLNDLNRVDTWFKYEGNTVESEYLREPALQEFREQLRQRAVKRPVKLQVLSNVFLRRGDYDQNTGLFKVQVNSSSAASYSGLPHLGFSTLKLGLEEQYPAESSNEFTGPILGIPMTLEQAITFEESEMTDSRGNREDIVMMTLVSNALINNLKLAPLERGQDASQSSFRDIKAVSELTGLSVHKRPPRQEQGQIGELVYEWPDTSFSRRPQSGLVVPGVQNADVAVPADLQAVAQRFQMSVVDGHLDTSTGNQSSFAAAIALGNDEKLLDKVPEAFQIAEALLSREEHLELFGGARSYQELDAISAESIHERIRGEFRQLFMSRAIAHNLPLLVVHEARLGEYDTVKQQFPLTTNKSSVYSGKLSLTSSGYIPTLVADTGDRWVPEHVAMSQEQAPAFQQRVFGDRSNTNYAAVRHGRFGTVSDVKTQLQNPTNNSRGQSGGLVVTLELSVQREVLLSEKFDEILIDLPGVDDHQLAFSELMSLMSKPVATIGGLLETVAQFPEVDTFKQQLVLSSNKVQAANEFDRADQIEEVNEYLSREATQQSEQIWLEGSVQLGEYNFESQSFAVSSIKLNSAPANQSSNQVQFRAKIEPKVYGDLKVSMDKDKAEEFAKANSSRNAAIRARVTPVGAVAALNAERPDSARLTITYQVNELAMFDAPREERNRQRWTMLSHDTYDNVAPSVSNETTNAEPLEPVMVDWHDDPYLNPDPLILLAAKAGELADEQHWEWLQENRHILDTNGITQFSDGFFAKDSPAWDRSLGQINAERFKQWVDALEFPELDKVKIHLATGSRTTSGSLSQCDLTRPAVQWSQGKEPTFDVAESEEQMREKSQAIRELRSGEFSIESDAVVGFINSSAMACQSLSQARSQTINAPHISLIFNTLPIVARTGPETESAVVTASVDSIDFVKGDSQIPSININLTFEKADYYSSLEPEASPIIRTITGDDLVSTEPQGKDPRLEQADVVGIKLGMLLTDAAEILETHFEQPGKIAIRRGFTTNPSRFEQGDLWFSADGSEYIVLFHEGNADSANVLGVVRGLFIEGTDFDRNSALSVLRSKYGPEDVASAEDSLNMVWGKLVNSWPIQVGRQQTGNTYEKGACKVELREGYVPTNLRDKDGTLLDLRELLQASGKAHRFQLRWPEIPRTTEEHLADCDYYLEAFHDDRDNTRVFVGMFDLSSYEAAFEDFTAETLSEQTIEEPTVGGESAVKF